MRRRTNLGYFDRPDPENDDDSESGADDERDLDYTEGNNRTRNADDGRRVNRRRRRNQRSTLRLQPPLLSQPGTLSHRPNIVQEYGEPSSTDTGLSGINHEELLRLIDRAAAENGIERPRGYTVSWHHNPDVEAPHFGKEHPMKPFRLRLTKNLIFCYGMHKAMDCPPSRPATVEEMKTFHTEDYLKFLERVTPENIHQFANCYGVGDDTPVFHGLFDFCSGYAGASVEAARSLVTKKSDIAINWTGGLHHAQRFKANGFCYVNDIVLAILQLLRFFPRVLYIDIDVHHGDGVEQAFWKTDRVMTLSFHKYAPESFFPGTGNITEYGPTPHYKAGSHFSLNVPLEDGIEDDEYVWLFREIVGPTVEAYRPSAIVLQCGADSLAGDRLGRFNLNIPAHGACLEYVKQLRLPLLVLGGGGYTPRNVARLWAYETALCIGATLRDELPAFTPHRRCFEPDQTLVPRLSSASAYENRNTRAQLEAHVRTVREYLRYVARSPSVYMNYFPPGFDELREQIEREYEEERQANNEAHRHNLEQGVGTGARGQLY